MASADAGALVDNVVGVAGGVEGGGRDGDSREEARDGSSCLLACGWGFGDRGSIGCGAVN